MDMLAFILPFVTLLLLALQSQVAHCQTTDAADAAAEAVFSDGTSDANNNSDAATTQPATATDAGADYVTTDVAAVTTDAPVVGGNTTEVVDAGNSTAAANDTTSTATPLPTTIATQPGGNSGAPGVHGRLAWSLPVAAVLLCLAAV